MLSLPCRESEGTFEYGNYKKEADDLHAVIEHFSGANHVISGILGHSKGLLSKSESQICITSHAY